MICLLARLRRVCSPHNAIGWCLLALGFFVSASARAQDPANGRTLYDSILVSGNPNCGSGGCHGPDPSLNINQIQNGDTPGGVAFAINTVMQMSFLRGRLTTQQIADLSAYIADPAAANTPIASLSTPSLSFGATSLGQSSAAQSVTVTNTGAAALNVGSVASTSADFVVSANTCASVAVGGSCSFSVRFSPTAAGNRFGNIVVQHNAQGSPSNVAVSGVGSQTTVSTSASSISFETLFVGQVARSQTISVFNSGSSALAISGVSGENAHFAVVDNGCAAGATVPPGGSCSIEVVFTPKSAAEHSMLLSISHNGEGGSTSIPFFGTARELPANTRLMIEYRVPEFDYYFITSRANEQALLDAFAAFQRTGASFPVYASQVEGTSGIIRYYFDKVAKQARRGSHFYTLLAGEIAALNELNPSNSQAPRLPFNEGTDSYAALPLVTGPNGSCASGQQPVLRLFRGNARFPDDPNHRFSIDRRTYDEFVAAGWDGEGVRFCVPAPSP
jgi:hypothetical protein